MRSARPHLAVVLLMTSLRMAEGLISVAWQYPTDSSQRPDLRRLTPVGSRYAQPADRVGQAGAVPSTLGRKAQPWT